MNSISHYGIPGQEWGTRNWQNPDGSFNEAGKERYFGTPEFKKENTRTSINLLSRFFKNPEKKIEKSIRKDIISLMAQRDEMKKDTYKNELQSLRDELSFFRSIKKKKPFLIRAIDTIATKSSDKFIDLASEDINMFLYGERGKNKKGG